MEQFKTRLGQKKKKKNPAIQFTDTCQIATSCLKINPMKEGLFPSLNSGAALHILGSNNILS